MVWPVTDKKELCEKKSFNSVAIWLLPKKHSSVISLKTCYGYFRQLLSYFATFFCPTNKDSFQEERFKPIGFLIRVKIIQDEQHIGSRYLISNFEGYFFWGLVWSESKVKWFLLFSVKKIIQTSNHYMSIWVLTHINSLVSKESYKKVFDRTEFVFDLYGQICPKRFFVYKKIIQAVLP